MIAAGFGFRSAAQRDSLCDAYAQAVAQHSPDVIATVADKAATQVFQDTADHLNLPIRAIPSGALTHQATLSQSGASLSARQTGSVAEAAALAAAGPGARLLAPRTISNDKMATCALAISEAL